MLFFRGNSFSQHPSIEVDLSTINELQFLLAIFVIFSWKLIREETQYSSILTKFQPIFIIVAENSMQKLYNVFYENDLNNLQS